MTKFKYEYNLELEMFDFEEIDKTKQEPPQKGLQERLMMAWAAQYGGMSYKNWLLVAEKYPTITEASQDSFALLHPILKEKLQNKFEKLKIDSNTNINLEKFAKQIQNHNLKFLIYSDEDYPVQFKILSDPPIAFYYKGDLEVMKTQKKLTVVGSRSFSSYAEYILNNALPPILSPQLCVVSGLALGIDALAHELCLKNKNKGAKMIGITGSGLDYNSFYPQKNIDLATQIIEQGGLVLSEYPPGVGGMAWNFPARNRLLASLGNCTWVVQASLKSGSLLTASIALELGKSVATSPADVRDKSFEGNLELMKNGAVIVTEPSDLITLLGISGNGGASSSKININANIDPNTTLLGESKFGLKVSAKTHPVPINFNTPEEKMVFEALQQNSQNIDQIADKTNLNASQIATALTMMEMQNLVFNSGQNVWQVLSQN